MMEPKPIDKVTGHELENRFRQWRARPRTHKPGTGTIVVVIIECVLIVAIGVAWVVMSSQNSSHRDEVDRQIAQAHADLDDAQVTLEDEQTKAAESVDDGLDEVRTAAQNVADLQQGFNQLFWDVAQVGKDSMIEKPIPQELIDKFPALGDDIASWFDSSTLIVDEEQYKDIYNWWQMAPYEADEIDPRFPWFECDDDRGLAREPDSCQWSVLSVSSQIDQTGQAIADSDVQVVWQVTMPGDDRVHAFAEGTWRRGEGEHGGSFINLLVTTTSLDK